MSRIILSDTFSHQLDHLTVPVELCDPAGKPLGHFVPTGVSWNDILAGDGCPYAPAQIALMQQESGGRPLDAIWQSLGQS